MDSPLKVKTRRSSFSEDFISIIPNFLPPTPHLREILQHLATNYPIYKKVTIEFIRKNSLKHPIARHCNGQMIVADDAYNLQVAIGTIRKPRVDLGILRTTMHEYRHAMQHEEGIPYDCNEANHFAFKILHEVAKDFFIT